MKKFVMGAIVGASLSLGASVLASNFPEVSFFPVKYIFNSVEKQLPEEYASLNYNGHAYVPIRFIAESTKMNIGYDDNAKEIIVNYGENGQPAAPVQLSEQVQPVASARLPYQALRGTFTYGNVVVTKEGSNSRVSFQLDNDIPDNEIGGNLTLYDSKANPLGNAVINHTFKAGISTYETVIQGDATNYKYVALGIGKSGGALLDRTTHPSTAEIENNAIKIIESKKVPANKIANLGDKILNVSRIISSMKLTDKEAAELVDNVTSN
ncbi:stalk domain-containing protein [Paenibacillus elgii]|uniref:stalk domain-containing protein n=1 Tax=Paenibacillus elgii TaxID=189691 RepID=UPI000248C841|nr:stalk domain-containing protein [Paenibacillus elgii]